MKLNLFGYIKYKLLKWLIDDICSISNCEHCKFDRGGGFGFCHECNNHVVDCFDIQDMLLEEAMKTWGVN